MDKENQVLFVDPLGYDIATNDVFYSPINRQVVYGFYTNANTSIGGDIFIYEADKLFITDNVTSPPRLLATAPEGYKYDITFRRNFDPWSPNGKYLAFISSKGDNIFNTHHDICIITISTMNQECLELPGKIMRDITNPAWSPDSQHVGVFTKEYDKAKPILFLLNIENMQLTAVQFGIEIPIRYRSPKLLWR